MRIGWARDESIYSESKYRKFCINSHVRFCQQLMGKFRWLTHLYNERDKYNDDS
jgi:hypothetical protein